MKQLIKDILGYFNWDKYWKRRNKYFTFKKHSLRKLYYYYWIRKMNRKNSADIGFEYTLGNNFKSNPQFNPHGINGIVIACGAQIGKNCYIGHQVTIGRSRGGAPVIGDNVFIGAGAKIFGAIKIGDNVRIGANCVVFEDIPDNCTVVLPKPRVIQKAEGYNYSIT